MLIYILATLIFLKEYDKNKYDIVINIISPITKHLLDYFIEKISFEKRLFG